VKNLGFNLSAGVLLWPVVFLMTDIINEYFGKQVVKYLSWFTVGLILYAFLMIYWAIGLSPNEWWQYESGLISGSDDVITDMDYSYRKIMGQGLWIIVGSMVAFLVGQLVDVIVFQKIRRMTGEHKIWLRATGSTLVSQFIDSFVVLFIAFYIGADWDLVRVLAIGFVNYFYKLVVAVILTPLLYIAHKYIDQYLGNQLAQSLKEQAHAQ
ncbi:MAG TPA: queuosine precursor transporter, partial [Saprospiraceae bacterium]|nr:queuosine precursor transporter [Saprospiraceae bacterium]